MINNFFLQGTIKKIQVSEPKDPKKNASAVVLLQYGKTRDSTGGPVEFVNAVMVRIPNYKYPALKDILKEGARVTVLGHLQGVFKSVMDDGHFVTELVADRVTVDEDENDAPAAAPSKE